jgi:hypothetical protein
MIVVKGIKAKRLKVDKFRTIMLSAMRVSGEQAKKEFEKTTKTWKNKPTFYVRLSTAGGNLAMAVYTDSEIYKFVDQGTKPHAIFAGIYTGKSNKKALRFHTRFYPKTIPGVVNSVPGFVGGPVAMRPYVWHPGTKPRNFDAAVTKLWQPRFKKDMQAAMSVFAKTTGHQINA